MKFNDANSYYRRTYGSKVYKVGISLNVTCPNRDGKVGVGGCIFCSEGGSGEFSEDRQLSIRSQIEQGIAKLQRKCNKDTQYIAYMQSFTNTYCSPEYLSQVLEEAISVPRVVAVSVATRPDCLPEEIMEVLENFIKTHEKNAPILYVELGLQTSNDRIAELINRCYKTSQYDEAVKRLQGIGANVITHVILGLPEESEEDMLNTVRHVCEIKSNGIKFTGLYVLENTVLAQMWKQGKLILLEQEEYFDIVERALALINEDMTVYRLTGDGPKSLLLAPEWTRNKRNVVNYINKRFFAER